MFKNVIFLTYASGIGGEMITYVRMAEWLCLNTDCKVFFADRRQSPIFPFCEKRKLKKIEKIFLQYSFHRKTFFIKHKKCGFPEDSIIITNSVFLFKRVKIIGEQKNNIHVLFLFLEPHTVKDCIGKCNIIKKIKKLKNIFFRLKKGNDRNALIFQDYPNFNNTKKFYPFLKKKYFSIPIEHFQYRENWHLDTNCLRAGYIGRNCPSKNNTLYFIADKLNQYAKKNKVKTTLFIVSDINKNDCIFKKIKSRFKNINTEFKNTLYNNDLDLFLNEKIDVVFTMGVSCLEAAKLGIVSFSVPASNKKLSQRTKIGLLQDFKEFSLGGFAGENNGLVKGYSFEKAITLFRNDYQKLSESTYMYAKQYFGIDVVMKKILKYMEETSFNLTDWE